MIAQNTKIFLQLGQCKIFCNPVRTMEIVCVFTIFVPFLRAGCFTIQSRRRDSMKYQIYHTLIHDACAIFSSPWQGHCACIIHLESLALHADKQRQWRTRNILLNKYRLPRQVHVTLINGCMGRPKGGK